MLEVGAQTTVEVLLGRTTRRDFVPLSRSFVQRRDVGGGAGPLAMFVRSRRRNALDLYLLAHATASAPPWDVTEYAGVWARALGIGATTGAGVVVSTNWTWLEGQRLVRSERKGGLRRIFLLNDNGSGDPYERPTTDFFKLPHAYWTFGWQQALDLPAKAVLLIALSLKEGFLLPTAHGATWYGLSLDTVKRGLRRLRNTGLLEVREVRKQAPRSPTGFTLERRYRLRDLTSTLSP